MASEAKKGQRKTKMERYKDVELTLNQYDVNFLLGMLRADIKRGESVIEQGAVSGEQADFLGQRLEDGKRIKTYLRKFRGR